MHIPYAYAEDLRVNYSGSIKLYEKNRPQKCRYVCNIDTYVDFLTVTNFDWARHRFTGHFIM